MDPIIEEKPPTVYSRPHLCPVPSGKVPEPPPPSPLWPSPPHTFEGVSATVSKSRSEGRGQDEVEHPGVTSPVPRVSSRDRGRGL